MKIDIIFSISHNTNPNEEIFLLGNIPELGNWSVFLNLSKIAYSQKEL